MQKLQTDQDAESKCQWRAQPQMRQLCHTTTFQGSGTATEEGTERLRELALRKDRNKAVFSGHHGLLHSEMHENCGCYRLAQDRAS